MKPSPTTQVTDRIAEVLVELRLHTLAREFASRLQAAGRTDVLPLVAEILELEIADRKERRVERLQRASRLPPGKTFSTLDESLLPRSLMQKLRDLMRGEFLERAVNVLAFGLPGVGKTHGACALGHALVQAGYAVLFMPAFKMVQELLAARRDLCLPKALRKLDTFDLIILDDIGYVQQGAEETEVLFTLLAERYERRSVLITSNLVFKEWGKIFKNPMTTTAAIDRLVHHSVILEFPGPSIRDPRTRKRSGTKSPDENDDKTHEKKA